MIVSKCDSSVTIREQPLQQAAQAPQNEQLEMDEAVAQEANHRAESYTPQIYR